MEDLDAGGPSDEEIETVEGIEGNFISLISEVRSLRKELTRVKRSRIKDRVVGTLFALIAIGFIFTNYTTIHKNANTLNAVKAQGIAGVVSNCAFTNLQSIAVSEMITDFERGKLISNEIGNAERARFQKINCVGLVSESGKELSICLTYPNQTDPLTGQPIPTTTTPEDKINCDKAAETQRKAIEKQQEEIEKQKRK